MQLSCVCAKYPSPPHPLNPKPQTLNPKPQTLNPKPENPDVLAHVHLLGRPPALGGFDPEGIPINPIKLGMLPLILAVLNGDDRTPRVQSLLRTVSIRGNIPTQSRRSSLRCRVGALG